MKKKEIMKFLFAMALTTTMVGSMSAPVMTAYAAEAAPTSKVLINEIESNDPNKGNDWVEIINISEEDIDISGWFVADDKGLERLDKDKTTPVKSGTILKAGEVFVLEENVDFDFGLGNEDTVTIYNAEKEEMDSYSWTAHAEGTYSRDPQTLEFVDQAATKGKANVVEAAPVKEGQLVINEINSAPDDWVEFINIGEGSIDISGYEIRDNSNDHRWKFAEGTVVESGKMILVKTNGTDATVGLMYDDTAKEYKEGPCDIGIGSGDSIRLYDKEGKKIDEYSWTEHASYNGQDSLASYGRYPDGTGSFVLTKETPNAPNDWYAPQLVINEVESDGDDTDWVEVYNAGTTDIDLSGYYMLDNDPVGHQKDVTPVAEGTVLKPGAVYVFDQNKDFTFGLGKEDSATIYNKYGVEIATYSWTAHANGVYARIPDGTGEFVDFATSTKGKLNKVVNPVVINEVQSNDPNKGPDWIELANPTNEDLDISGLVIKDDDDKHGYTIPEGTTIPANGFFVITEDEFGFGLGKGDAVRIFENGELIQSTTWPANTHTSPTWGLYPDVNGNEYRNTKEETPGAANKFDGVAELTAWNRGDERTDAVKIVEDKEFGFLEDASGLDFHNGQLYAVDNGTATFWILDVAKDGTLSFAQGFENGKKVAYQKDVDNLKAAGPDTEGITVDGEGFVYLASERDNSAKGVNWNVILKANPNAEGDRIVAAQEWDITKLLPDVSANMGIEAVEWVSNADVNGKLFDKNTGEAFDSDNYPKATAGGVFFTALEDNGHVYAFVLNNDSTATLIADIDSQLGGAMALDYDKYENVLRVASDNGYNNKVAEIRFNGTDTPDVKHVAAPTGLDVKKNYEGFAIADATYTVDGMRPVYRFEDGVKGAGDLCIGSIACDYKSEGGEVTPPTGGEEKPPVTPPTGGETVPPTTGGGTTPPANDKTDASSQTGDDFNTAGFAALALMGLGAGSAALYRRKTSK